MPQAMITVEQTRSPIRRPCVQRKTLKGLRLNRIGRMVDLPDTPTRPRHDRQGPTPCPRGVCDERA